MRQETLLILFFCLTQILGENLNEETFKSHPHWNNCLLCADDDAMKLAPFWSKIEPSYQKIDYLPRCSNDSIAVVKVMDPTGCVRMNITELSFKGTPSKRAGFIYLPLNVFGRMEPKLQASTVEKYHFHALQWKHMNVLINLQFCLKMECLRDFVSYEQVQWEELKINPTKRLSNQSDFSRYFGSTASPTTVEIREQEFLSNGQIIIIVAFAVLFTSIATIICIRAICLIHCRKNKYLHATPAFGKNDLTQTTVRPMILDENFSLPYPESQNFSEEESSNNSHISVYEEVVAIERTYLQETYV